MKTLFNETPQISYSPDINNHIKDLEQGYASHIESKNGATVLCFQNVEDHIDGNGLSLLWMLQGTGQFFMDGDKITLNPGDAILFDDNEEHGFDSDELCVAASFVVDSSYDIEKIRKMVKDLNSVKIKP